MASTFMGRFENSVSNRRVSVPQSFRQVISPQAKNRLVAVRGLQQTLYMYPYDNWKHLETVLVQGNPSQKALLRHFRFYATELVIEGPGRILLPQNLLELANIHKKVIFLGEGSYFSLWNPDALALYEESIAKDYDQVLLENRDILL